MKLADAIKMRNKNIKEDTSPSQGLSIGSPDAPFGIGLKTAFGNLGGGVQQLYGQAVGDEVLLERLRGEATQRQQRFAQASKEAPFSAWSGRIAGEIVPGLLGPVGGASLAGKMGLSALGAATGAGLQYTPEDQSRLQNMQTAGLVGAAFPVAGKGLSAVGGYLKEKAAPYAAAFDFSKMGQFLGERPQNAFGLIKKEEDLLKDIENKVWEGTKEYAATPAMKKARFDTGSYEEDLSSRIKQLEGIRKADPYLAKDLEPSIRFLEQAKGIKLNSWEDVMRARQSLNKKYKQEMTAGATSGNTYLSDAIDTAKGALGRQTDINLETVPSKEFADSWRQANLLTQKRNELFNTLIGPSGRKTMSPYANLKHNVSEYAPEKVLNPYIPKDASDGMGRLRQFEGMVNSHQKAAEILRPETFKDALKDGELDVKSFFNKYGKLSDEQKEFLFGNAQKNILDESSTQFRKNPKAFGAKGGMGADAIYEMLVGPTGIGGGIGTLLGSTFGPTGAIMGGLGGMAAGQKIAPWASKGFMNVAQDPFAAMLRQNLARATPYAVGAEVGGQ